MAFIINPQSISQEEIKNDLETYLKSTPDNAKWKDFFKSQTGQTILELISGLGAYLQYNIILGRREAFWKNAQNRSSVIAGAESLGYSSFRGRNALLKLKVTPSVTGMISKFTPIGTVRDQDLIILDDIILNSGIQTEIEVVVGRIYSEEITINTNKLASFRFTNKDVSNDLRVLLNDTEVSISEKILDLLKQKFVVQSNSLGSVDVMYLNTTGFSTTYNVGDKLKLEWIGLKNLDFLTSDVIFDYGNLDSVEIVSVYQEPESIESIKINASLYNETQFIIRGREDYNKAFKQLDSSIVSTSGEDLNPAIVLLSYVLNDSSLYSDLELNQILADLSSIRPFGVAPPIITHPNFVNLKLNINLKLKSSGDSVSVVDNILSPLERQLEQSIDFSSIENQIESNSFVKIARVSIDAPTWEPSKYYLRGNHISLPSPNGKIYEVIDFIYKSGSVEPTWSDTVGSIIEDNDIYWVVKDKGICDNPDEWEPNYRYKVGDIVKATSGFPKVMFEVKNYSIKSNSSKEIQEISFSNIPASGTWRMEFNGESTIDLPYNASAFDVQNALNGLESLSNVTVTGSHTSKKFTVNFEGSDSNKPQPPITFLSGGNDEVQCLEFNMVPNSGQWTLKYDGNTTGLLFANATAIDVKNALEALPNIGSDNVHVTGNFANKFIITFIGDLSKTNVPQITVGSNSLISAKSVSPSVAELTAGENEITGNNEIQRVNFSVVPDTGVWALDFDQKTTNLLQYNATALQVKTALEALTTIGVGNVNVTGNMSDGFIVEFKNSLGLKNVIQMTNPTNSLIKHIPVIPVITTTQQGSGGYNEVQKIDFNYVPDSGTWKLSFTHGGSYEITDITVTGDISKSLNGTYFLFDTPSTKYYVWYNVGSTGIDPSIPGRVGIMVSIAENASSDTVKTNTISSINSVAGSNVVASAQSGSRLRLVNVEMGSVNNALAGNTGFTIVVINEGINPTYETAPLSYNITASSLEIELESLPNIGSGNVEVSGNFSTGFIIGFRNGLGNQNVNQLVLTHNSLIKNQESIITISTINDGVEPYSGVDAVQKITFDYVPDSGSWAIKYNSETTELLGYNATSSAIQTALNDLSGLSDVVVTGNFIDGFTITFSGTDGKKPQPLLEIVNNTLHTSTANVTITPCLIAEGTPPASNLKDSLGNSIEIAQATKSDGVNPEPDWFGGICL